MSSQIKTILLTILTLSAFVIALVELSGVSSTALFNKYNINVGSHAEHSNLGATLTNIGGESEMQQRVEKVAAMPKTNMEFVETKFDFGTIKEGEVVKHEYRFRNTGTAPLLISKADASCGCTVPSFPKEPIAPGAEGVITVQFDSHGRSGHQEKNVIISSNAQVDRMSIGFVAEVE